MQVETLLEAAQMCRRIPRDKPSSTCFFPAAMSHLTLLGLLQFRNVAVCERTITPWPTAGQRVRPQRRHAAPKNRKHHRTHTRGGIRWPCVIITHKHKQAHTDPYASEEPRLCTRAIANGSGAWHLMFNMSASRKGEFLCMFTIVAFTVWWGERGCLLWWDYQKQVGLCEWSTRASSNNSHVCGLHS